MGGLYRSIFKRWCMRCKLTEKTWMLKHLRFHETFEILFSYSKSHLKSVTFALHVFRLLLKQFLSDFHEI